MDRYETFVPDEVQPCTEASVAAPAAAAPPQSAAPKRKSGTPAGWTVVQAHGYAVILTFE
ncbi:hypothetical protein [Indioceanicola profundi]|uniref:hypothetical protein n=1 Tax=Indioceanicola profundi TaxID=2220096 RepID=UPI000E6AAF3F|nr:hypothetical protein [Indioceanicola profundi]